MEGFLRYEFGGLYLEGLIFGILRYLDTRLAFCVKVIKLYDDLSKSTFPSKVDKKICFGRFFVNNRMLPV